MISHCDNSFFEYLNGNLADGPAREVAEHIAACADCKLYFDSLIVLKAQLSNPSDASGVHPSVGELADFFYSESPAQKGIASHVATCTECGEALAQYARAEAAAAQFQAVQGSTHQIPAAAWSLIADWEDSPFARTKDDASLDLMNRLSSLIESKEKTADESQPGSGGQMVAVTVLGKGGEVLGVEMFEQVTGGLRHSESSDRFNEKLVHAILEFGAQQRTLISDRVRGDRIELTRPSVPARVHYFIVED